MDALKALVQKKKDEKRELLGDKKQIRRSELEEVRLKRLREEEQQERLLKEQKRQKIQPTSGSSGPGQVMCTAADASKSQQQEAVSSEPELPRAEVIRRLRRLGQPATLFGEADADRLRRLLRVEKEVQFVDEARGGGENSLLELKRQERLSKQKGGAAAAATADSKGGIKVPAGSNAAAAAGTVTAAGTAGGSGAGTLSKAAGGAGPGEPTGLGDSQGNAGASCGGAAGAVDETLQAFQQAAALLAQQRVEEALPVAERIASHLRQWCEEWEADLEGRPEEVKDSGPGRHATIVYRQSMKYMEPLFDRLKRKLLDPELEVGLWMMVQAMRQRNYLAANDIYLRLAIGNAPWPIGVTSVGIHERSAREKISHVMNTSGQAHIMNDEATRKFFTAIKRLMTNLQRLHPTDPSRSVDFNLTATEGLGRGSVGGGSDKVALLEAEAKGESWQALGLPAAPHHIDKDGSVRIPEKWKNILSREVDRVAGGGMGPPKTPPRGSGSAPKTPPRPTSPA